MRTSQAIADYLEAHQGLSPRTLEQYCPALARFEAEFPEMPERPQPLRAALYRIEKVWVRDVHWRVWSSFCRWCEEEYDIPNPMHRVRRPELPEIQMKVLTRPEMARVLAVAYKDVDRAIVGLALGSGIRASEFGRMRISDIGIDTVWVWGKGWKRLQVPITPATRQLLDPVIEQARKRGPDVLLFTGEDGRPLLRFAVYRIVRGCMDRAGIAGNKRGPHCLRHSLGTSYIDAGGDLKSLMGIMRHRSVNTTQKYVHYSMGQLVNKHHQFSPLKDALLAAQVGFFDAGAAVREAEEILTGNKRAEESLKVNNGDLVSVGAKQTEMKPNHSSAEETPRTKRTSNGKSKWGVTPLLPGMTEV